MIEIQMRPSILAAGALIAHRPGTTTGCHLVLHLGPSSSYAAAQDGRCFFKAKLPGTGTTKRRIMLQPEQAWSYYGTWRRLRTAHACTIKGDMLHIAGITVPVQDLDEEIPCERLWHMLPARGHKPAAWTLDARALARMQRAVLLCAARYVPPLVTVECFTFGGHYAFAARNPYIPNAAAILLDRSTTPAPARLVLPEWLYGEEAPHHGT